MTDRAALTALYLDEVARREVSGSDLLSVMQQSGMPAAGDLVLKPAPLHGGLGVLPGWHP
jgi:hypothetical protein